MIISEIYEILHAGDKDKALELFQEYCSVNKDYGSVNFLNAIMGIGDIYMQKKDFEKAEGYFSIGNQITQGKNLNVLLNLGIVYRGLGEDEKSILYIEKAKFIDPDNKKILAFEKDIQQNDAHLKDVYTFKDKSGNIKLQIVFRLTLNCNQRCIFCNVVKGKNTPEKEVILSKVKLELEDTLEQYKNIPKEHIELVVSGGEPALHSDFWKAIDLFLQKSGRVLIQTNGVMFAQQENIDEFNKRNDKQIGFYISFHSHIKENYNKITKTNQYDVAVRGIKNILTATNNQVDFNFVFNQYNIHTFPVYIDFINKNFFTIHKKLHLNISAITGVTDKNLIVKYSLILDDIYKSKSVRFRISGLVPGGAMCDIPYCVYPPYIDLDKEIKGKKIFISQKEDMNNTKLHSCKKCRLNNSCPGILKVYIEKFGEKEFIPLI